MKYLTILLALMLTPLLSAQEKPAPEIYRHIVLFQFKDTAKPAEIKSIETAFKALPTKIKTITNFEWGTNTSPENLNQGLTHAFIVTFKNKKDLEAYIVHPDHKAFVTKLLPILEKATVIDFVPQK